MNRPHTIPGTLSPEQARAAALDQSVIPVDDTTRPDQATIDIARRALQQNRANRNRDEMRRAAGVVRSNAGRT